jgi:hypothetical protein
MFKYKSSRKRIYPAVQFDKNGRNLLVAIFVFASDYPGQKKGSGNSPATIPSDEKTDAIKRKRESQAVQEGSGKTWKGQGAVVKY